MQVAAGRQARVARHWQFPARQLWVSALRVVAALWPSLPIVGYEHGVGLAAARRAGCQALGPLRVWTRNSVP
jgi:hypothetical protein